MLVPIFIERQESDPGNDLDFLGTGCSLAFCISKNNAEKPESIMKYIHARPELSFCVIIEEYESSEFGNALINLMISLSFHPGYVFYHPHKPVILLRDFNDADVFMREAESAFIDQGFSGVDYFSIASNQPPEKPDRLFYELGSGDVKEEYGNLLSNYLRSKDAVLLPLSNCRNGKSLDLQLRNAENEWYSKFPRLFEIFQDASSLLQANYTFGVEYAFLQERYESLSSYAISGAGKDITRRQMNEVVNFYKYEYEILPTWFKRFGHVVKVLMGKRSFKSLYDDNAKKYKQ